MPVNLGGLNVSIGVDTRSVNVGIQNVLKDINNFKKKVAGITVGELIRKDAFTASNRVLRQARNELDDFTAKLSSMVESADADLGKFAASAKKNIEKFTGEWNRAIGRLSVVNLQLQGFRKAIIEDMKADIPGHEEAVPFARRFAPAFQSFKEQIQVLKRSKISDKLRKALDTSKIFKKINLDEEETIQEIEKLSSVLETELNPAFEKLAVKLREAYTEQKKLEFKNILRQESSATVAIERRTEALDRLTIEEARLRTEISQGINVRENRLRLMRNIERRQELGIELTEKQVEAYRKLYAASIKLPKFRGVPLEEAKFKAELQIAKSVTEAQKRKWAAIRKLEIEEARLRTEIQQNIDVERNRLALYKNLARQQELLGRLDLKRARELAMLSKEARKAQRRGTSFEMFSPEWFKLRAGWFLQLRAYWALYRGVREVLDSVVEAQKQLARAMRTARSEIMSTTEITDRYREALVKMVTVHGATWQQAGEVLYQLGSAGLTAEKNLAAAQKVMSLIIATEGDAQTVTKAVAGIYNNFADTMKEFSTDAEKFNHIINALSTTWSKHQIEISEIVDGYRYASTAAKMAGVSFDELTAYLAVANDHMIKGARAGRAFQSMISRISRAPAQFARAFGLEKIDITKPLKLSEIFGKLHKRLVEGKTSVAELQVAFERLGLRATPEFRIFVENWDEWKQAEKEAHDELIKSEEIEEKRLHNLGDQFRKLGNQIKGTISTALEPITDWITEQLEKINKTLEKLDRAGKKRIGEKILRGLFLQDWGSAASALSELISGFSTEKRPKAKPEEKISESTKSTAKNIKVRQLQKKIHEEVFEKLKEQYGLEEKEKVRVKEIIRLRQKESEIQNDITENERQARIIFLKTGEVTEQVTGLLEEASKMEKKRTRIQNEINRLVREENQERNKTKSSVISRLRLENKIRSNRIKEINFELSRLKTQGITKDEEEKANQLIEERTKLQKENIHNNTLINIINQKNLGINTDIAIKQEEINTALEDRRGKLDREAIQQARIATTIKEIEATTRLTLSRNSRRLAILQSLNRPQKELLKLQLENIEIQKEAIEKELELERNQTNRANLQERLVNLSTQEYQIKEQIAQIDRPLYGAWRNLQTQVKTTNEFIRDLATTAIQDFGEGFSNSLADVMAGLDGAGAKFKDFFQGIITEINRTIVRWLAMQAIMGIVGHFANPTSENATSYNFTSPEALPSGATGGVFPRIEAFRQFSSGGLTTRPTLAVLGDNPSQKEIVIPEENIQSDEVSGYVRKKDNRDIMIMNLLTKEDIAMAMAANPGKNVIINTIGQDMNNLGRTAKALRSV